MFLSKRTLEEPLCLSDASNPLTSDASPLVEIGNFLNSGHSYLRSLHHEKQDSLAL